MKRKAMVTTLFFAASLLTAGGALAAEESRSGQDASKYGTSSSDTTRSGTMERSGAASGQEQQSGQTAATGQAGQQTQNIQSVEDLKNFTVQDSRNQKVGKVSQVLVDLESGRIGYAVVSSGGVLGIGGEKYIVPFNALRTGEQRQTLTLDVQKDQLKQAPKGDIEQVMDREKGREIHQFYGVSPYWEESGASPEQQEGSEQMQHDQMQQEQMEQQHQMQQQRRDSM